MRKIIKDHNDNEYVLNAATIKELDGRGRSVRFSDLKKNLPKNGQANPFGADGIYPRILHCPGLGLCETWLSVNELGWLSIGCTSFGPEATRAIYKAAGIRRKVSTK